MVRSPRTLEGPGFPSRAPISARSWPRTRIERHLFELPASEIPETGVLRTYDERREAYRATSDPERR
jgi:hypothetical protein